MATRRLLSLSRTFSGRAFSSAPPKFLISTTETVSGHTIVESFGLVAGSTVRARNIGQDIFTQVKAAFGGELSAYTELLSESRKEATERMQQAAEELGANAVIAARFSSANVTTQASEILVYGTAVKVRKD